MRAEGSTSIIAEEVDIRNVAGDYIDHSSTVISSFHLNSSSGAMNLLVSHISNGSIHDSDLRCDAPKCHPETRVAVQEHIMSWIRKGNMDEDPKQIMWITGPAGTGKTSIAGSIAESCQEQGLLAASYFFSSFSGTSITRIKKPFIATLVYQLILHPAIVGLREQILAAIRDNPAIFMKRLDRQLEELVLRPLRWVAGRSIASSWPQVIVIDGLDECEANSEDDGPGGRSGEQTRIYLEILSVLARASRDPYFPFRIIVACRPEPAIRQFFDSSSPRIALEIFLDETYDPDSDITLFLTSKFSDIQRRCKLPSGWPSGDVIKDLVEKASGQFIYAATVIRFIGDGTRPPQRQLDVVLQADRASDCLNPFASLDALYNRVLRTSPDPRLASTWLCALKRYWMDTQDYIRTVLESYMGETEHLFENLTSIIRLTVDEDGGFKVEFYHRSFLDFLRDSSRSVDFHVSDAWLEQFMKDRYYAVLKNRGPQGRLPKTWDNVVRRLCVYTVSHLDIHRDYVDRDIQWWIRQVRKDSQLENLLRYVFVLVHKECRWYRCLPACAVWRWVILSYCEQRAWRLPTTLELFRDRFLKFKYSPFEGEEEGGRCIPLFERKRVRG